MKIKLPTMDDLRGRTPIELTAMRNDIKAHARSLHVEPNGEARDLSDAEQEDFERLVEVLDVIDGRLEKHAHAEAVFRARPDLVKPAFGGLREDDPDETPSDEFTRHPLARAPKQLQVVQRALVERDSVRVRVATEEERAALTTATHGAPRAWGANVASGPRLLHMVAGVPQQQIAAIFAQHPTFTLPTASAGVGEGVTVGEYASSTAGSVTLARFGRFTDLSQESMIGASANGIVGMHTIGVARDLDATLINAVETAAGSAVSFTADVPAAIRKALAQVADNTAAESAEELVVLVHPDNAALIEAVTPTGGETIGEGFTRFSGAIVYPSSAVNTGFMTVANLRAGTRFFEARALTTSTDLNIKTSVLTVATDVIGGYGMTLAGGATGFAIMVDVVTP